MTGNRIVLHRTGGRNGPKLGRMLVVSMIVHLLLLGMAGKGLQFRVKSPERPVYYVDLREPPKKVAAPAPAPAPSQQPPATQKSIPAELPKPVPPKIDPPRVPERVLSQTKPTPPKASVKQKTDPPKAVADQGLRDLELALQGIEKKQQKQPASPSTRDEYEAIKAQIAALTASEPQTVLPATQTKSGSSGTVAGAEPGVDERTWIEAFLKEKWRFSQYQIEARNRDAVECALLVNYGPDGVLREYRFEKGSGNEQFDTSVKSAVLKGKQLPFTPGRELKFRVVFNLKDMTE